MIIKTVDNTILNFQNVVTVRIREADNRLMPYQIVADCLNQSMYLLYGTTEKSLRDRVYKGLCESLLSQETMIDVSMFATSLENT